MNRWFTKLWFAKEQTLGLEHIPQKLELKFAEAEESPGDKKELVGRGLVVSDHQYGGPAV
tara:strand:+ start:53 stop:232 length:180 start_codon:yes stop_codon:yes gene_type:complete